MMQNTNSLSQLHAGNYILFKNSTKEIDYIEERQNNSCYIIFMDIFTKDIEHAILSRNEIVPTDDVVYKDYKAWKLEENENTFIITIENDNQEFVIPRTTDIYDNCDKENISYKIKILFDCFGECQVRIVSSMGISKINDAKEMDYKNHYK